MEEQDKKLLLKDLCARLPYGVIIDSKKYNEAPYRKHYLQRLLTVRAARETIVCVDVDDYPDPKYREHNLEDCKPYLRPMRSITDKEMQEIRDKLNSSCLGRKIDKDNFSKFNDIVWFTNMRPYECVSTDMMNIVINYLDKQMLDHRNLIGKGLALEALEGMYNTKTE